MGHVRYLAMAIAMAVAGPALAQNSSMQMERGARNDGAPDVREELSGRPYRYVGGEREQQALHEAIGSATSSMNFVARPVARGRLRDRNQISPEIAFRFPPGAVDVNRDGKTFRSPDRFVPVSQHANTGDAMTLRQGVQAGKVVQVFTTNEGERRDEFIPSADGSRLAVRVTVRSSKLQTPLRYQLSYAR